MTDNKENMTYEEALKPAKKMTMNMVKEYGFAMNMSDEKLSESVKEILLQPYMARLYQGRIAPQDVAEFAEDMANSSRSKKTAIISGFAHSVDTTDKDGNGDNAIGGVEADILLKKLNTRLSSDIDKFADKKEMERTPPAPEPTKLHKRAKKLLKAFLEVGRVTAIATGLFAATYATTEMLKENNDKPNNKDNTEKKTVSEKQNNKTTYTSWAKAAERNHSSR